MSDLGAAKLKHRRRGFTGFRVQHMLLLLLLLLLENCRVRASFCGSRKKTPSELRLVAGLVAALRTAPLAMVGRFLCCAWKRNIVQAIYAGSIVCVSLP
jgi:hypothetical protein